jgi:hypothetical protein
MDELVKSLSRQRFARLQHGVAGTRGAGLHPAATLGSIWRL